MESLFKKYCSPEWQEFIDFHKTLLTYDKNSIIFNEGDQTKGLYIITKGKVKIITNEIDGKDRLIRLAADGDILGHRGFGGNWTYPISAITLEETTVTFLPLKTFNAVAKSNNEFLYQLMMFFAEELRSSEEKIKQLPVRERVAKAIYNNYEAFGVDKKEPEKLSFTLSRKDLASKAGTSYESTIRVITNLCKEGIIHTKGKSINLIDIEALRKTASPSPIPETTK